MPSLKERPLPTAVHLRLWWVAFLTLSLSPPCTPPRCGASATPTAGTLRTQPCELSLRWPRFLPPSAAASFAARLAVGWVGGGFFWRLCGRAPTTTKRSLGSPAASPSAGCVSCAGCCNFGACPRLCRTRTCRYTLGWMVTKLRGQPAGGLEKGTILLVHPSIFTCAWCFIFISFAWPLYCRLKFVPFHWRVNF